MKHKRNGKNGRHSESTRVVRLEFKHPTAEAVAVAGTFNDWRPEVTPMVGVGEGRWLKELVLPPGRYEYLLVADGQWTPDPQAGETAPNPFGGQNSVILVPNGSAS
jgi:1,4-alpha-glucan branching enzyme